MNKKEERRNKSQKRFNTNDIIIKNKGKIMRKMI